jgi:hypothetical protein
VENPLFFDLSNMQKSLFEAQNGLLQVQKGHQTQLESVFRWQESVMRMLDCLVAIVTESEPADSPRPAPNIEAIERAQKEIEELRHIFNQKPTEPEA